MKSYLVKWTKTVRNELSSEIEAESAEEAADIAVNGYKGRHGMGEYEWPDIDENELSVIEETEPTVRES